LNLALTPSKMVFAAGSLACAIAKKLSVSNAVKKYNFFIMVVCMVALSNG